MKLRRFKKTPEEILESGTNKTLDLTKSVSSDLLNNEVLGKTKAVKRWGRIVNDTSSLLKSKRDPKTFSDSDFKGKEIKIDTSDMAKFNAALNRMTGGDISKEFSEQEKAPKEMLERAKKEGVIQKGSDGTWRIVSLKKGTLWSAHYKSREKALGALRAYQKNKRGG